MFLIAGEILKMDNLWAELSRLGLYMGTVILGVWLIFKYYIIYSPTMVIRRLKCAMAIVLP